MDRYRFSEQERKAIESLQTPFAVYQFLNKRVVTLALSDGFLRLLGYTDREQAVWDMDHNMYKDAHPDDITRIANAAVRFAMEGGVYDVIYRSGRQGSDGYHIFHARGEHVLTEDGVRLAQVWYMDEGPYSEGQEKTGYRMSEALTVALHEESILRSNRYDSLTGLPNLAYFFELAEEGRDALVNAGRQAVMLYIDLNGMKYYNHRHGFAEGDRLLRELAKILVNFFGHDNCCHIGADRFAVFTDEAGIEETLRRLFDETARINGGNSLPVRVGLYSNAVETVAAGFAFDRAKMACDGLLKTDISGFAYYSDELRAVSKRRQHITTSIDRAIREKWIKVYYQPIVRAVNGKVCDEEALARWIDPEEGFLSPAEFIPYLEEAGLIYKLDLYVVEQVLEKIRKQEKDGVTVVPHSVNLSRSDFDACDMVEEIRQRVDAAGVSRSLITIEITESIIGSSFDFIKEQVSRFRELGFPVWMDDFGSGYSSLDVLQSIRFDLIKFDMSFMRKLDEGDSGRIILAELTKMATALDLDTVCEGVEKPEHVRFLQAIGCSKLQGFYFCKPLPTEELAQRIQNDAQIGYEDPDEAPFYETIGRLNLYDLSVLAIEEDNPYHHAFNTLPMGILEIRGDEARFLRSNRSYREFMHRSFGLNMTEMQSRYIKYTAPFMKNIAKVCGGPVTRIFYDDRMPDGSVIHSFARWIGSNPVTGGAAVAVAVLSVSDPDNSASYADIARALAADYYSIYVVNLDTDEFIEYSSPPGRDELAVERHGADFFTAAMEEAKTRLYAEDREMFLGWFTRENIIREMDAHGVFTSTYRLTDNGTPMYVNMKITRMQGSNRIIVGISIVDSQMKQREAFQGIRKERDALARVMAIAEDYIGLYSVNPATGHYVEYSSSGEYQSLDLAREGDDFFKESIRSIQRVVHPEDQMDFLRRFNRGTILREIRDTGVFKLHYRLMIRGKPRNVTLKIVSFGEGENEKLLAGVRAWRARG